MFGFLKKSPMVDIIAPMSGKLMDVTEVSDEVFSQKMVGDGIAIDPTDGLVVAPCDGKIVQIFNTNHAIGMQTKEGLDVLIHLGLDTVELKGEGFTRLAEVDTEVKQGDPLMKMDLEKIKSLGKSTISPIIITNPEIVKEMIKESGVVTASRDKVMTLKIKK